MGWVSLHPTEMGEASWYGAESVGTTASGELYATTAAHRTLPFNSRIRVTNLKNGRAVMVRVNDRGPNVAGRLLDVSETAAERLGFLESGEAPVRITLIRYPKGCVIQPAAPQPFGLCPRFSK
jgi:rare lipoprotein A